MIDWIIYPIISLILISIVHYLINFLKDNLTVPKVKDVVVGQEKQYKDLVNTIKQSKQKSNNAQKMKNELKEYLQGIKNDNQEPHIKPDLNDNNNETGVTFLGDLDNINSDLTFSSY